MEIFSWILILGAYNLVTSAFLLMASEDSHGALGQSKGLEFVNPLFVYKHNKVNFFGAILVSLFYTILCPIGAICYWIYKICTVGRK